MAKQVIATSDVVRTTGVNKINGNFTELYDAKDSARPVATGGTGANTASGARTNLGVAYGTTPGTVLEGSKDALYAKKASNETITGKYTFQSSNVLSRRLDCTDTQTIEEYYNQGVLRAWVGVMNGGGGISGGGIGDFTIRTFSKDIHISANGQASHMSLTTAGNVGIGTIAPASPLHLYQNNAEIGAGAGLTIEQNGTGDAVVQFLLTGVRRWVMGVDNSDFDKFKFSATADVGSGNFWINTSGHIGMNSMPTSASGGRFYVDGSGFVKWAA